MNIDQITDIAYEVVSELEPAQSYDVFDVSVSSITFQSELGLLSIRVDHQSNRLLKETVKSALRAYTVMRA